MAGEEKGREERVKGGTGVWCGLTKEPLTGTHVGVRSMHWVFLLVFMT